MFRAQPVSNKMLSRRWEDKQRMIHYEKLRKIQATVDSSCPSTFGQVRSRAKREQLMEDRFTEIERENRILLEKMSHIMNHGKGGKGKKPAVRSLNKETRKKQLVQITMENQAMLKRLQEKQPHYNIHDWEDDRRKNEKMLKFICEYPYRFGIAEERRKKSGKFNFPRPEISTTLPKKSRKLSPLGKNVVFKQGMKIGGRAFLVEIHKFPEKIVIYAYHVEAPDSFSLELTYREAKLLMGNNGSFETLAKMLAMEGDELVLIDPRASDDPLPERNTKAIDEEEEEEKDELEKMTSSDKNSSSYSASRQSLQSK